MGKAARSGTGKRAMRSSGRGVAKHAPRGQQHEERLHAAAGSGAIKPQRPPTQYELQVYELCKAIPSGSVSTYGAMAQVLQSSARAVGQSLRRNPFAPQVPCHRVVAADLELGGFSGSWGLQCASVQRKKAMLQQEGVAFQGDKVAASCVLRAHELEQLMQQQTKSQL